MQIFLFIALILMGATIIFAVQNTATTTVSFLAWQLEGSLALVLLVAASVGALISFFFSLPTLIRDKWTVRSLRKQVNEFEANQASAPEVIRDGEEPTDIKQLESEEETPPKEQQTENGITTDM